MPANNPSERAIIAAIAANTSWFNTENRTARTAPARAALDAKFLAEADGDPLRAASLRKAHYLRLSLRSAQSRRKSREAAESRVGIPTTTIASAGGGPGDEAA
jgi:hypothetical protein